VCEPITASTAVIIGISAATAAAGAAVSYAGGKAAADTARYNQKLAQLAAADALRRGDIVEGEHRRQVANLISRQRAQLGASGAVVDVGSALAITEDSAALGELDALTIRNNAAREAWGYQAQASQFGAQAQTASVLGTTQAATTLLTGGIETYGAYRQYK